MPSGVVTSTYDEYTTISDYDPGKKDEKGDWIKPPTWHKKTWTVPGEPIEVDGYA